MNFLHHQTFDQNRAGPLSPSPSLEKDCRLVDTAYYVLLEKGLRGGKSAGHEKLPPRRERKKDNKLVQENREQDEGSDAEEVVVTRNPPFFLKMLVQ